MALRSLEFQVHTDLYLVATASYADIVLPIASGWEREGVNAGEKMHQRAGVKLHHGWVPERSSVA
jgi:anaerobic selenocysteine-containing dehydrogenase